jgi:hypothetical protein
MTASAAHLPLSARRSPVRPPRPRRLLCGLAGAALLASAATGCVTVHGATALIPSARQADAAAALRHFVRVSNAANTKYDPSLNPAVETGALGAIDEASIKVRHVTTPAGDPGYQPLVLTDTRFLIPRQRGWPKWFVADSADNKDANRYVLVFIRDSAAQPWKASYLLDLPAARLPPFATDSTGHVEPAPLGGTDLLVRPGQLADRYAAYLQQGDKGSTAFADGPDTSQIRRLRSTRYAPRPGSVTQFADQAADQKADAPVALRLKDGGALVLFTTQHQARQKQTSGRISVTDPTLKALMAGTPRTTVTEFDVAEQAVLVPAGSAGGKVTFLQRIVKPVGATGG